MKPIHGAKSLGIGVITHVELQAEHFFSVSQRSSDSDRGISDPPCCTAGAAVPGALHPSASAHHGLPEGTWFLYAGRFTTKFHLSSTLNLVIQTLPCSSSGTFTSLCILFLVCFCRHQVDI